MAGRLRRRKQGIEAVGSLLFYHIGQAKHCTTNLDPGLVSLRVKIFDFDLLLQDSRSLRPAVRRRRKQGIEAVGSLLFYHY